MPPCDNNPSCKSPKCPIKNKQTKFGASPESILSMKPSWSFYKCDRDGQWAFTKTPLLNEFWDNIMPRLKSFEQQTWSEIEGNGNHFIPVRKLNKCARDRLSELMINEESLFSLRIGGTLRIYGLRPKSTLIILWYDNNHGDNNTCVCKSKKKHT